MESNLQTIYFGAGCFWGVEEVFRTLVGVQETKVGYMGGTTANPTYEQVCAGGTGHVETVAVTYDPTAIDVETLLNIFWENHDPTQIDRQGPDVGVQYRSVIFYTTPDQRDLAEQSKKRLNEEKYNNQIATAILPAPTFYPAEEYHQQYLMKRGLKICH
jgi:peptide-methionine (S)-S-oxide reductase